MCGNSCFLCLFAQRIGKTSNLIGGSHISYLFPTKRHAPLQVDVISALVCFSVPGDNIYVDPRSLSPENHTRFYKCKNISIKMLKDVGMTVPKSRETRAVYAATQGVRACNNNNMYAGNG